MIAHTMAKAMVAHSAVQSSIAVGGHRYGPECSSSFAIAEEQLRPISIKSHTPVILILNLKIT